MKSYDLLAEVDAAEMFAHPLGPYSNCLSTEQIVDVFEFGAHPEQLGHALECSACGDLIARSNRLARMLEIGDCSKSALEPFVLLAPVHPVVEVADPNGALSLTLDLLLFAGSNDASLDISTLRLDGALISVSPAVEPIELQSKRLSRTTFRHSVLSTAVRQSLAEHANAADQITVSGMLRGEPNRLFSGKATLGFVQLQKARAAKA
jgi:hypothetical protein